MSNPTTAQIARSTEIAEAIIAETKEAYGDGTVMGLKIRGDEGDYRYRVPASEAVSSVAHHIRNGDSVEVWFFTPEQ